MNYLDLTLPTPAENLACDEALLDLCEDDPAAETLRFWEPSNYFVVVGYSNQIRLEANEAACRADKLDIHRRCSGGGTVLQGPGCLNYSLILRMDSNPALQTISDTNCHIMARQRDALQPLIEGKLKIQGHTDLAVDGLKFSGNAQRRKRHALIFHGTFLLNFDLGRITKYLPMPSREPDYRQGRAHELFLTNLQLSPAAVKTALQKAWSANEPFTATVDCQPLLKEKYGREDWNTKF